MHELVFVIAAMGDTNDALDFLLPELVDTAGAIEFASHHGDKNLWGRLIQHIEGDAASPAALLAPRAAAAWSARCARHAHRCTSRSVHTTQRTLQSHACIALFEMLGFGERKGGVAAGRRADDGHIASAGALVARKNAVVHAISGGLAASGVRIALLPLDAYKTRLQLAGASVRGMQGARGVLMAHGGFTGLYRGLVPAVGGILPAAALYMGLYTTLKRALTHRFPRARTAAVAASAGVADMASTLVRVPCERLKQQLQAGMYPHVRAAVSATMATPRAVRVLYAGLVAQLCRDMPHAVAAYVVYERLRRPGAGAAENLAVGGVAGAVAAAVSNPMDVVKTRLMTVRSASVGSSRYRGVFGTLGTVVREEGPMALYRGLAPRICAKMLQSALFFAAYEGLRQHLSRLLEQKQRTAPV